MFSVLHCKYDFLFIDRNASLELFSLNRQNVIIAHSFKFHVDYLYLIRESCYIIKATTKSGI